MTVVRFGPFALDTSAERLTREGERVHLPPQAMSTLIHFVTRAGELVTRDDLRQHIWGDRVAEYDQGINFCIRQVRQALGDDAADPTYLETVPRRGYRFVHAVSRPTLPRRAAWAGAAAVAVAVVAAGAMLSSGDAAVDVVIEPPAAGLDGAVHAERFDSALRASLVSRSDVTVAAGAEAAVDAFRIVLALADSGGTFQLGIALSRGADTIWTARARGAEAELPGLQDALVADANRVMTDVFSGGPKRRGETEVIRTGGGPTGSPEAR